MSIRVSTLMKKPTESGMAHIKRVSRDSPHTLVVKQGGASACLTFTRTVIAADLLQYCGEQLGWQVEGQPFVVDGERYAASKAKEVALEPTTARVDVGQTEKPSVLEFTRDAGSKG